MSLPTDEIRETVRDKYAEAARAGGEGGCCGPETVSCTPADPTGVFGSTLYDEATRGEAPEAAVNASLGCGVPTAVADLSDGEVVLDLGSGAGADVLISARRVAPSGRAIGLDMTDEMLELARANAADAAVENVEFVKGYLEELPVADASVDVVISNCVINLSGDKPRVLAEAARVLRPGGRFAVSDVIADPDMDQATKASVAAWTGCVAGALTEAEFRKALEGAGFADVEIEQTHRVHEHAASAIVRARKPSARGRSVPGRRAADTVPCVGRLDELDLSLKLDRDEYEQRLETAEKRLAELRLDFGGKLGQDRLGPPVCALLEGWDASGKGGAIKRLVAPLDLRHVRVAQFGAPTPDELRHHFLWRFWSALPGWGGMAVFDRTWYGRVLVERVEGFASEEEWERAYGEIVEFERMNAAEGMIFVKLWMHLSEDEQLRRFRKREKDPLKAWKLTEEDWRNREKRGAYEQAVEDMLERTDHGQGPWTLVEGDNKKLARVKVIETVIAAMERGAP